MILTLEVTGPEAGKLGPAQRKVFNASGGTIGRLADNAWVLKDPYVSSHHAVIRYTNGQFYVEDTSTNGTFINSPDNRLRYGEPYALKSGDRIIIDPFEIRASIAAPAEEAAAPLGDFFDNRARPAGTVGADPFRGGGPLPKDPFFDDPFEPPKAPTPSGRIPPYNPHDPLPSSASDPNLDPLKALFDDAPRSAPRDVPRADRIASNSPIHDHYQPPPVIPPPDPEPPPAQGGGMIPDDWDKSQIIRVPSSVSPRPAPAPPRVPPEPPPVVPRPSPRAAPPPPAVPKASPAPQAKPSVAGGGDDVTLASVLAATGLENVAVTPELAQSFGEILRVVVSGVMDVLQARQRIKDEFRMRVTSFKRTDNNPLKFSANVDDALHNLLVKRNAAYLGPVDAFEDAFEDLRNHQVAMLAGVRVAFEAMMAELDPDRLQEEFDRQLKKSGGLVPAKLRYWELYRDKLHDMVRDPDTNFREWFGEEFAKAYEEQLERLKAQRRGEER
jgi:type VI secretion system FHA domain protein